MSTFQYYKEQKLNVSKKELWSFISNPRNLSKITPPEMGFVITTPHISDTMYQGQIIMGN